jgi:hypothetical protein
VGRRQLFSENPLSYEDRVVQMELQTIISQIALTWLIRDKTPSQRDIICAADCQRSFTEVTFVDQVGDDFGGPGLDYFARL